MPSKKAPPPKRKAAPVTSRVAKKAPPKKVPAKPKSKLPALGDNLTGLGGTGSQGMMP
jgi:hypothetical protein